MKKMIMVLAATLICGVTAVKAQEFYDFSAVSSSGDTLYYLISNGAAVVTCPGDIDEDDFWPEGITQPQGTLVIDSTVTDNGTTYTVAAIGEYAFYGCSGITSVSLPSTVEAIGGYAFYNCSSLASVNIPASVANFGGYVFTGTALPEPIYKDNVFVYMPAAATGVYTISNQITYICGGAFYNCASLTQVILPNSVTEIGPGAFLNCDGLTQPIYNYTLFARLPVSYSGSYTIPDGITTVCASSFNYTSGLTGLIMPNSVTSMGNGAVGYCTNLTSVTLSDALTEIPGFAFMRCTALPTITLPASINSIGNMTFSNCTAMDSIVVKSTTPPSVGFNAFRNVPASCVLVVPCGTSEAYTETSWGTTFTQIVEDCGSGESVEDVETSPYLVYVTDGCIAVYSQDGSTSFTANVYDMSGRRVASLQNEGKTTALPSGIYIVCFGDKTVRKVVVTNH
ncbi:MAG: leucine-rich repeat domain-containing protein [Bacteroidales bacterium]|nr:leucine-rich repeat domain-containing protein [Bacteroidales bacterium]